MHPIEYQAMRKALGLSVKDIAWRFDKAVRTAQRWETYNEPPNDVQEWILEKWTGFTTLAGVAIAEARELDARGEVLGLPVYESEDECIAEMGLDYSEQAALYGHIILLCSMEDLPYRIDEV